MKVEGSALFDPKIRIPRSLHDLLRRKAEERGYSGLEEFVIHVLETAVADAGPENSEADVRERLKGLGYLG